MVSQSISLASTAFPITTDTAWVTPRSRTRPWFWGLLANRPEGGVQGSGHVERSRCAGASPASTRQVDARFCLAILLGAEDQRNIKDAISVSHIHN